MEPIFTDLPKSRRGHATEVFTDEVRDTLRSRPGEWAVIHKSSSASLAQLIRTRDAGFEAVSRVTGTGDEKYSIFARYVGEAAE